MRWLVLGPLEVWRDERQLTLGGRKQRLVLAHLLIRRNRLVSSDQLIERIWGDDAPAAARSSLHAYVSNLRKQLGDGHIESHSGAYRLRFEQQELDAEGFSLLAAEARRALSSDPRRALEMLEQALSLWRGEPFADMAYEPSLQQEIDRLAELRIEAQADLMDAALMLGRHAELIADLEGLVRAQPLNERQWGQLMLALYRAGRQADALAAFHRLRQTLAEELGIDPSPTINRLHLQILQQDPAIEVRGEPLRGYQLLEQLASETSSVTYRAYQPQVGREVLIKAILPPRANDPKFIRGFESRAQQVARLEHPRIVPLYDFWREPDGAYLVIRHLPGGNLRQALDRSGPMSRDRAIQILGQVAEALAASHRQHLVHGDVSAENVLLDEEGNAYLANFALDVRGDGPPAQPMRDVGALAALALELMSGNRVAGPDSSDISGSRVAGADGSEMSPPSTRLPLPAGPRMAIERALRLGGPGDQADAAVLLTELQAAFTGDPGAATTIAADDAPNPYKGLHSFREADAADFFGREALINQLLEGLRTRPRESRLLAVVGPSGSGKSSVVQAGLLPALRRGEIEGSEHWYIVQMVPGNDPFEELERALRSVAARRPVALARPGDRRALLAQATRLLPEQDAQLLLVIDQFEELFTQVADERLRREFIRALHEVVTTPGGNVRAIITLRADFYDRPLAYRQLARLLAVQTAVVAPLAPEELERAIRGPAQRLGVKVENELTARLVAEVTDQPGGLPLLQYALTELFNRRDGATMTLDTYHAIGGVEGALARRATEIYSTLGEEGRLAARHLFLRLVTPSEVGNDTRRRIRRSELAALEVDQAALGELIGRLGEFRLLSFDRDPESREPTVEVAHEALLWAWPRLRHWIEAARADLRAQRRLAEAAAEWEAGGRDPELLLGGRRLAELERLMRSTTVALTSGERAYLVASLAQREAERRERAAREERERMLERRAVTRLRALTAVLATAFLVSSALGFIALEQRDIGEREALRAERESLAADAARLGSLALRTDNLDRSLLLALAATQLHDSSETTTALLASLLRAPAAVRVLHGDGGQLMRLALNPDGTILAASDNDGTVILFDLATGQWLTEPYQFRLVVALAFSPSGEQLAVYELEPDNIVPSLSFIDLDSGQVTTQAAGDWAVVRTSGIRQGVVAEEEIVRLLFPTVAGGSERLLSLPFSIVPLPGDETVFISALEAEESAVIDLSSGGVRARFPVGGWADVTTDGRLAALAFGRSVRLLDLASGETRELPAGHSGTADSLSFTPDGQSLLTAGDDGQLIVWNVTSGTVRDTFLGHGGRITDVVVSGDSRTALTSSVDGLVITWDLDGSRRLERLLRRPVDESHQYTLARDFSPDGSLLALSDGAGGVELWDVTALTQLGEPFGHEHGPVWHARFARDGSQLVTTGPAGVRLWDLATRSAIAGPIGLPAGAAASYSVFSPNGFHLAVSYEGGGIFIWDASSGALSLHIPTDNQVHELDYSEDGTQLAAALDGGEVAVWDLTQLSLGEDGISRPTMTWSFPADPTAALTAQFSADGRLLATGGATGAVIFWDLLTGQAMRSLTNAHAGSVAHLEFHPDGHLLASGGSDGLVVLWDVETGQRHGSLPLVADARDAGLRGISGPPGGRLGEMVLPLFNPDGSVLAGIHQAGAVAMWPVDMTEWQTRACSLANRELTEVEWRQYVPGGRQFRPVCAGPA